MAEGDLPSARLSPLRRLEHHVGRRVLSGFVVLVPLLITLLFLNLVFASVDGLFHPLIEGTPLNFPGFGVAVTVVLLYIIGAFFSGRRLQSWQDAVLTRIPVVRGIYGVARQATEALSSPTGRRFSRVVFLEWPRPGVRAMGFVTGHMHPTTDDGSTMVGVFIPTVPNPTSGNLAWVREEEVIETDFSVEEAMKTIFSGGIVAPRMPVRRGLRLPSKNDEGLPP